MSHAIPTLDLVGTPQERTKPIARIQAEREHLWIVVIDETPARIAEGCADGDGARFCRVHADRLRALFDADMDALADVSDADGRGTGLRRTVDRCAHRRHNLRVCCSGGGTRTHNLRINSPCPSVRATIAQYARVCVPAGHGPLRIGIATLQSAHVCACSLASC
jgi:hypothetical protein